MEYIYICNTRDKNQMVRSCKYRIYLTKSFSREDVRLLPFCP